MNNIGNTPLTGAGLDMAVVPPAVTANSFDGESEEALALRYGRAKKLTPELTYEFTRDPALLQQYTNIYEEEFRIVQNAMNYSHHEDEHDRRGHFLIVRQGNLCVGGARLNAKTPRQPHLLPMEMGDFRIDNYFEELRRPDAAYGQIGRVCLLPDFRGGDVTRMLFWHIHRKVVALGLDVVFASAPLFNARAYRKSCLSLGINDVSIYSNITLPPYPGCEEIKMCFMKLVPNKALLKTENSVMEKTLVPEAGVFSDIFE